MLFAIDTLTYSDGISLQCSRNWWKIPSSKHLLSQWNMVVVKCYRNSIKLFMIHNIQALQLCNHVKLPQYCGFKCSEIIIRVPISWRCSHIFLLCNLMNVSKTWWSTNLVSNNMFHPFMNKQRPNNDIIYHYLKKKKSSTNA